MAHLLVVDDDGHIREVMRFALEKAGHTVVEAADGSAAYRQFESQRFDLIVLDIVMPEDDGLELCRKIRRTSELPIIFVSSRDDELDRVLGLEMGGDDYLTKPFSPRELSARVAAVLRRTSAQPGGRQSQNSSFAAPLSFGPLSLDPSRHRFELEGASVALTVAEFGLLRALMEVPGRVLTRAQLVERAYGTAHFITDRTVDSHVRRVRQKLGSHAHLVETVYGVGYRLKE